MLSKLFKNFIFKHNKIVIYTAIFGGKDILKEPLHKIKNADFICFSDEPRSSRSYKVIVRKATHTDPNLSAKKYKLFGDSILDKYEYSIWADGSMILKFDDAKKLIDAHLQENDIALFAHPDNRDCIYDECDFLIANNHIYNYDDPKKMRNQIEKYRKQKFPRHFGLVAGGFIIRRIHSPHVKKICKAWWNEIINNSRRDQLSFNYVIWKLKEKYTVIPGYFWDNEYINALGKHLKR